MGRGRREEDGEKEEEEGEAHQVLVHQSLSPSAEPRLLLSLCPGRMMSCETLWDLPSAKLSSVNHTFHLAELERAANIDNDLGRWGEGVNKDKKVRGTALFRQNAEQ